MTLKKSFEKFLSTDTKILSKFLNIFIISTIIIYLAPYVFLGSKNYFTVTDNLDSIYADFKVLLESGKLFSSNISLIEQPLGGLPRSSMSSQFNFMFLLYYLFGPETTYIIVRVLMTLVGFFGMKIFLDNHILKKKDEKIISLSISLCFSILPFTFYSFLSVAAMPLVLYALLEIRKGKYYTKNWMIIIMYPFFSSFVVYGFFFLFIPFFILLKDLVNKKKSAHFLLSIILLLLFFIFVEYRLFDQFLLSNQFVSHRIEKFSIENFNFYNSIKVFVKFIFNGGSDANSLQGPIIVPFILISTLFMIPKSKKDWNKILFLYVITSIILITVIKAGFPPFSNIINFLNDYIPFNFKRFVSLYPLLWMLALALVLSHLQSIHSSLKLITISILILQTLNSFKNHEFIKNINFYDNPNVESFFAKKQFSEIKNYINKPINSYRVASIGLHPSISLYNGFYTADGYFVNYPLEYKKKFRKIIEKELNKDKNLKSYYDNWGNRVYLFSSELGRKRFIYQSGNKILLKNLDYNWKALYDLNVRFIFSSVKIDISNIDKLKFKKKFVNELSAWDIYLYQLIEK